MRSRIRSRLVIRSRRTTGPLRSPSGTRSARPTRRDPRLSSFESRTAAHGFGLRSDHRDQWRPRVGGRSIQEGCALPRRRQSGRHHQVVRAERVLRPVRTAPPTHLSAAACHGLAAVHMHRSSGSRVRTCDLGINSPALCQLSYPGKDSGQDSRGPNRVVIFGDSPHEPLSGAMPDSSLRRGAVAQWLERGTHNPLVVGSIPTRPTSLTSTNAEIHLHTYEFYNPQSNTHPTPFLKSDSAAMASALRFGSGVRERSPGLGTDRFGGRDPVSGKRVQVSRTFHGGLRDANAARAELLVEVSNGRHTGTGATMNGAVVSGRDRFRGSRSRSEHGVPHACCSGRSRLVFHTHVDHRGALYQLKPTTRETRSSSASGAAIGR